MNAETPGQHRAVTPTVSLLARCLLCGLYVTPESARPHFENCHPDVVYAVAPDVN